MDGATKERTHTLIEWWTHLRKDRKVVMGIGRKRATVLEIELNALKEEGGRKWKTRRKRRGRRGKTKR